MKMSFYPQNLLPPKNNSVSGKYTGNIIQSLTQGRSGFILKLGIGA